MKKSTSRSWLRFQQQKLITTPTVRSNDRLFWKNYKYNPSTKLLNAFYTKASRFKLLFLQIQVVILKKSPSRSSAMLHGLISAAELNYDGASVSLPPTLRSNYRLFNLVKVQVLSKMYKDNFFSEALQMRNCTTRQSSYVRKFIKYCNKI